MSLFGQIFGDAKDVDASEAPKALAEISKRLLEETAPLRGNFINQYTAMTSPGGISPQDLRELTTLRSLAQEAQGPVGFDPAAYDKAREEWLRTPEGQAHYQAGTRGDVQTPEPSWLRSQFERPPAQLSEGQRSRLSYLESLEANPSAPGSLTGSVTASPQFVSLKDAIGRQFALAKKNVLATTPQGGGLSSALSQLEGQRAGSTAAGIGDLAEREMTRAFALATGQTPTALGGLGSASMAMSQVQAAQAAQAGQAAQGIGYGIGSAMGRKGSSSGSKGASTATTGG